jgi:hypothetical protein
LEALVRNGAPARLLLLYFCGDDAALYRRGNVGTGEPGMVCPRDEAHWRDSVLDDLHARMGWHPGTGPLGDRVHEIFLPVTP